MQVKRKNSNKNFFDRMYDDFLRAVRYGKNELKQVFYKEDLIFDDNWILTIEGLLFSVESIAKNPMRFIKDELELTVIEKAKRISSKTIRHLAANSRDVAQFTDGDLKPLKVLTKRMEEDLHLYENRVVYTLINRLVVFMEARYRKIKKSIDSREITRLKVASSFKVGNNDVECDISFNVSEPRLVNQSGDNNTTLIEKIENIRKRLMILQGTSFYKELSKSKPVHPPIIKTNAILMNRDYNNAYKLWLFMSAYRESGFTVNVSEKQFTFDRDYYDDLTSLVALGLRTMIANNATRERRFAKIRVRATKVKRYRLGEDIEYEGVYKRESQRGAPEEVVNEYYYQAIKEQLIKSDLLKDAVEEEPKDEAQLLEYERRLETTFAQFFKAIMKINNELFLEKQGLKSPREETQRIKDADEIKQAIKTQRTRYNKSRQLVTLKLQDIKADLRREADELVAMQLLYARLAALQAKSYDKVISEESEEYREILLKAESIVKKAEEQRDAHLERALNKIKAGEARRRLLMLKEILSNTERDVQQKLLEDFTAEISEQERQAHELNKVLIQKQEERQALEQKRREIEEEIGRVNRENEEYLAANTRLLQDKMREALIDFAAQARESEERVRQEKEKLALQKKAGEEELAREQGDIAAHLAALKAENEKLYNDGLAEAEANKQAMLAAVLAKIKENEEYISAETAAIEQKLRRDLAKLEVERAQNKAHIESFSLEIASEKSEKLSRLEAERAKAEADYRKNLEKLQKDFADKKKALEQKYASELNSLEEKRKINKEYIKAERLRIEKEKEQNLAELADIQAQNIRDIKEAEANINAAYEDEQIRLEMLKSEQRRFIAEQQEEATRAFLQEKYALAAKRRAYRKEIRDALNELEAQKQSADAIADKLLEGRMALYPVENVNRVYKYVVVQTALRKDIRSNRVSRLTDSVVSDTARKWQWEKRYN
ncbi:MAG: hypothetical protein ACOYIQ_05790 [Christensenellales bacterium]|jgi:exonuclease SbcC